VLQVEKCQADWGILMGGPSGPPRNFETKDRQRQPGRGLKTRGEGREKIEARGGSTEYLEQLLYLTKKSQLVVRLSSV
jgi:hypothetical protein